MSFNIKIFTTKAFIISALLFSFSPAFAQYKLELEWQKEPGGQSFYISSITKSDNDSLIYVSGGYGFGDEMSLHSIKTYDGSIASKKVIPFDYSKIIMSKDGKVLTASGNDNSFVGILDPTNFEISSSFTFSNLLNHSYNDTQNQIVACGISTIKVYDVSKLQITKELNANYFKLNDLYIRQANITNDGKKIIYSYLTTYIKQDGTEGVINYLRIIDMEGNVIKSIDSVSSTKFVLTHDGKTLIYFQTEGVHFINLETIQDELGITHTGIGDGFNPQGMTVSNDDKFLITATQLYDLKDNKRYTVFDQSDFANMCFDSQSNSLYCAGSNLYKYNLSPTSSVINSQNGIEYTLQVNVNSLVLKSTQEIRPDLQFNIAGVDGKLIRQILPNDIQLNNNSASIDISSLATGVHLLQVSSNSEVVFSSKFMKVD